MWQKKFELDQCDQYTHWCYSQRYRKSFKTVLIEIVTCYDYFNWVPQVVWQIFHSPGMCHIVIEYIIFYFHQAQRLSQLFLFIQFYMTECWKCIVYRVVDHFDPKKYPYLGGLSSIRKNITKLSSLEILSISIFELAWLWR